jgi:hypothetical protein
MITITLHNLDKARAAFEQMPLELADTLGAAGREAGEEIVDSPGLRNYPPEYHAPQFAAGFKSDAQRRYVMAAIGRGEIPYVRGQGRSERYGSQFYVEQRGYSTFVGNRASYARYLAGGESAYMAAGGWRKLEDVALEKIGRIMEIFAAWIDRLAQRLGL